MRNCYLNIKVLCGTHGIRAQGVNMILLMLNEFPRLRFITWACRYFYEGTPQSLLFSRFLELLSNPNRDINLSEIENEMELEFGKKCLGSSALFDTLLSDLFS